MLFRFVIGAVHLVVMLSSFCLHNNQEGGASLLLVSGLLRKSTEASCRRESTHEHIATDRCLRETKSSLSCGRIDSTSCKLLLLPKHLLLHLSVHLLLP